MPSTVSAPHTAAPASAQLGFWSQGTPAFRSADILALVSRVREPAHVVLDPGSDRVGIGLGGKAATELNGAPSWPLLATLPPLYPEWLGDRSFLEVHGVRFPYVSGAMANGIATVELVTEMARAGMLGFFGAAGLAFPRVQAALDQLVANLGDPRVEGTPAWGMNLIHAPQEPDLEANTAALYVQRGVRQVSAAAFMGLTAPLVRVAYAGIRRLPDGRIHRPRFIFAKISRPEVAKRFMEPAPTAMLQDCVQRGWLTADEAQLAAGLPVAEDYIVESDSGGHTDNRPLGSLFPTISMLRDRIAAAQGYTRPIRIGAAGGIGTPQSVASAFGLGAAFVLTGSVNQGCVESGLSPDGKQMLAQAGLADVGMAPAADMFELGVEVQVLMRGTMFAQRGHKLYELYRRYDSLEAIPAAERAKIEKSVLRQSIDQCWADTKAFWMDRDPREVDRAEAEPRHKMALVFRSYLGRASRWAIVGEAPRRMDYQIWCGPAMGAFNDWAKGSFLEAPEHRSVVQVAKNLLEGAAVLTRAHQLRAAGVPVPASAFDFRPRPLA